jgi:hypothetical protein
VEGELDEPPPKRETLIAGMTPSGALAHVDLDEHLRLYWVRRAPWGGPVVEVDVDVSSLRGATKLDIWCAWSPLGLDVHVVDRDNPDRMVTSEKRER